jgi:hypothetical protein
MARVSYFLVLYMEVVNALLCALGILVYYGFGLYLYMYICYIEDGQERTGKENCKTNPG